MKRILYLTLTAVLFARASTVLAAGDDPLVEKRKTYSKSYTVGSSEKISLNNSFGEMKMSTWDKNEVKVDITIVAKAATEEKAQEILDKIRIEDGKNSSGVYFKTQIDNINNKNNNNNNNNNNNGNKKKGKNYKQEGMEINYVVYLPANNPLDASNSFGAMIIGDYKGAASLESKFGSLTAGDLSNVKEVSVEFGKADIAAINNGKVTIKFSKAVLKKFTGSVNSNFEFCEVVNLGLDNAIEQLNIKSSYSTLGIELNKALSASFNIKTSFGDVDNNSAFDIREENNDSQKHGPNFNKQYYGTAGKGTAKITISSEFGTVKLL